MGLRGKVEGIATLELHRDTNYFNQNEGNLLGLIRLLSETNEDLFTHLCSFKEKSKQRGSGSYIHFLSHSLIERMLDLTKKTLVRKVVEEINGGWYAMQVDSTLDVSTKEQCSVNIR